MKILADFHISALTFKCGRINVLGDVLSHIREVETNVIDLIRDFMTAQEELAVGKYEEDVLFGPMYQNF